MSRIAEVIVLAQDADEVMEPLTRYDDSRTWKGVFHEMSPGGNYGFGWGAEFVRLRSRSGLLRHLESLPWPRPETVQVLIHDEEDDCFGLWMIHDGKLVEIPLPRTRRGFWSGPYDDAYAPDPGVLYRTDCRPIEWPEESEGGDRSRPSAW
ncbi:hypothetical protein [Streptomyces sp. NRRL S-337]|uniref:hypothetical protein n=1 Tax=Streptomyces sp. NRRL S-337 TaxID=1463900 RepID=UPI00068A59F6|nr:hypothetical protein [Streptomyces sp. NRRL S-337]